MIPKNFIDEWRQFSKWTNSSFIEQDLIICRALVALYDNSEIQNSLAFRGGTALNKIFFNPASRYSEDLDFVQIRDEPIGQTISHIRNALDPWLGNARWSQKENGVKLIYRFQSEELPRIPMRLKIEINTTEQISVLGYLQRPFSIDSSWFKGNANICTFQLEELMATKLRALYQRLKGRDLFDLWVGMKLHGINCQQVIEIFQKYNRHNNTKIYRSHFEENLSLKMSSKIFLDDIKPLISEGLSWNEKEAFELTMTNLITLLP